MNIGNAFSQQGDYEKANEQYTITESHGREYIDAHEGNHIDGTGIVIVSMKANAFALKRAGKGDEGKVVLKEVIAMQIQLNSENEKKKAAAAAAQGKSSRLSIH